MKLKQQIIIVILLGYAALNVNAQIPLVYSDENTGATCEKPSLPDPGDLNYYPLLPDPFEWTDATGRVEDFSEWACRRNEIMAEIEEYEIGPKPLRPENITATFEDSILTVEITENGATLTLTSEVVIPEGDGPFPIVIGMNSGTGSLPADLFEGTIQIPFMPGQVAPTHSGRDDNAPYFQLYPELTHVGYYSAWSWGVSRLIDGIEIVQAELNANIQRIAVSGCSYAGKMALFAGAYDERIALTFAQESGGGGVNSWRVAESLERNVEKIDNTDYTWFMQSMRTNFQGQVGLLPHDHHELMALIVPRALFVMGNPGWEWLGDEAGYVSCVAAGKVYETFGIDDRFGYSFRGTSNHCATSDQLNVEVKAFIDKFLHADEEADTDIRVTGNFLEFVNPDYWINWPINPDAPSISIDVPQDIYEYQAPATVVIETTIPDPVNPIELVTFYNGNDIIAEISEAPFNLTIEDLSAGSYSIYAEVIDSEDLKGYSNNLQITVQALSQEAYKTSSPPIIDGIIDGIWEHEKVVKYKAENILVGSDFTDEQLSGYAKMLWDDDFVYLLAVVTDAVLINDSQNNYEDDCVEFYFDASNSKSSSYEDDDVQYSFRWDDGSNIGTIPASYSTEGIEYAIIETENGYNLEVKIPWSTIQGSPDGGKAIGFDFMINDDDTGGGRDRKLSWNATADQAWQNPSYFGTIILIDDEVLASVNDLKDKSTITAYPNPANNSIFVTGCNSAFDYEIYGMDGALYLSGANQNEITIEQLRSGIYLLKINSKNEMTNIKFVKE